MSPPPSVGGHKNVQSKRHVNSRVDFKRVQKLPIEVVLFSCKVQVWILVLVVLSRVHIIIFFQCPRYANARQLYIQNYLVSHNTHELLHGKESASDIENEALFMNIQEFIIKSNRFILN